MFVDETRNYQIGHNQGPTWRQVDETPTDSRFGEGWVPPDVRKPHYFKCDIQAFRKAIYDKPLDIRGAFLSALLAMYEHMEPLPADDQVARMRCGIVDIRVYRRVKRDMLAAGLLFQRADGRISNKRFEDEIEDYLDEYKRRRDAAKVREEKARVAATKQPTNANLARTSTELPPNLARTSTEHRPDVAPHLSKKDNENNGCAATTGVSRARVLDLDIDLDIEREEKKDPPTPQGGLPPPEIPKAKKGPSPLDALRAFESYNAVALRCGLQQAVRMTPDRERKIIARLRDNGPDDWAKAMDNLERSKFLTGQASFKGEVFRANLDFILQPTSFGKLLDGSYGLDRPVRPPPSAAKPRIARESDNYEPGSQEWLIAINREDEEMDRQLAAKKAKQ